MSLQNRTTGEKDSKADQEVKPFPKQLALLTLTPRGFLLGRSQNSCRTITLIYPEARGVLHLPAACNLDIRLGTQFPNQAAIN